MSKLMFDALDLSPNGKQVIASGIDAVQLSIFRMMTTPRGSLPDFPNIGFEMEHFFGIKIIHHLMIYVQNSENKLELL